MRAPSSFKGSVRVRFVPHGSEEKRANAAGQQGRLHPLAPDLELRSNHRNEKNDELTQRRDPTRDVASLRSSGVHIAAIQVSTLATR
jgi:hypothetical protein